MAERPLFLPQSNGTRLYDVVNIRFPWHSGMAPSQKRKNVVEMHEAARNLGINPVLEISSKSELEIGRRLSAFNLKLGYQDTAINVENAFQGSKVFENGGPFTDLYFVESRQAKRDERLKNSGRLIRFEFEGKTFPLTPPTAFYDWLYIRALYPHREWLSRVEQFKGFSDIEFNPEKSINCQAKAFASYISLRKRNRLDIIISDFDLFVAETHEI